MKPVRLEVRGFTAFREPAVVDFEGRRLFVITGPTGAGKSSLLDAMTWALFGQVPRVGRSVRELLSQGEREMSVMFDFEVRGQRYRVARRHPSTTSTRLERIVDGQPVPMADRASDVTREVERVLGMDYATFTRAIVLPQGQFDSFLRGDTRDRRSILSQLIGLGVYERAGAIARSRAGELRTHADAVAQQLEQLAFATPEVIAALGAQERELSERETAVQRRRTALQHLGETARTEHEQRQATERATADTHEAATETSAAEVALAAATAEAEAQRAAVAKAERERDALQYDQAAHERLRAAVALLDQLGLAREAVAAAEADAQRANEAERLALTSAEVAQATVKTATAAAAAGGRARDEALAAIAREAGRARRARARAEEEMTAVVRRADTAEANVRTAEQRLRELEGALQELAHADADLARALEAATRAESEQAQAAAAQRESQAARAEAEAHATAVLADLERARRENAAAFLLAGLRVGDRCPVCGDPIESLDEHDAPDLAAADAEVAAATARLHEARAAAERAGAALAGAEARTGEAMRTRDAARARHEAVVLRLAGLDATPEQAAKVVAATQEEADAQTHALATARSEAQALVETTQALREALARVPSSVEIAEAKRAPADAGTVIEALDDAIAAHAAAEADLRDAERELALRTSEADAAHRAIEVARQEVTRAARATEAARERLAQIGEVPGDPKELRSALDHAEQQAARLVALAEAMRQAREALAAREATVQAAEQALARARDALARRQATLDAAAATHRAAREALGAEWQEVIGASEPNLRALKETMEACETERLQVATAIQQARADLARATEQLQQSERMHAEVAQQRAAADLMGSVGTDLRGDRFIAFLLHESMHLLAQDASDRLTQFSNGRYELRANEDEFAVVDHLNGDEERSVKTLSGGETFLASLALALALSEQLPDISGTGGAISLDSLFLDEGFGALDAEALDLAVQGLETLASGSRMIGVISHVEELADRLPDRIHVEKGSHGSTVVA